MATREFALGVIDGRAGRGHRSDYATWGVDEQWNYERGRQWAALVPRAVALKRNGEITAEAKRLVHTRHPRMPMECTSVRPPRLFFTSIAHGAHKPSILQAFSASLSLANRNDAHISVMVLATLCLARSRRTSDPAPIKHGCIAHCREGGNQVCDRDLGRRFRRSGRSRVMQIPVATKRESGSWRATVQS